MDSTTSCVDSRDCNDSTRGAAGGLRPSTTVGTNKNSWGSTRGEGCGEVGRGSSIGMTGLVPYGPADFNRLTPLALTTQPVSMSTSALARWPRPPRSVTLASRSCSPLIDFTGKRHSSATEPTGSPVVMLASPRGALAALPHSHDSP